MSGWVATEISQTRDSPIPITTPASTPKSSVAGDGGDRDPEVEALDPEEPAHLGQVHHPHHDRLDDQGGQHRLGQVGEQRREDDAG